MIGGTSHERMEHTFFCQVGSGLKLCRQRMT
jgi:hypothetical protein